MNIFSLLFILLILSSCQTSRKTDGGFILIDKKINSVTEKDIGFQLTYVGSNNQIAVSPQGDRLTFISENRSSHQHRQVYEYDIKNKTEKRVTFSDGQNYYPQYSIIGDVIFYSSNTDKIKEFPSVFYPEKTNPLASLDIYSTDSSGKVINRIIETADSSMLMQSIPGMVDDYIYIQKSNEESKIYHLQLHKRKSGLIYKTKNPIQSAISHKDGTLYWIENNQIFMKVRSEPIVKLADHMTFTGLNWAVPDKKIILYLAQSKNKRTEIGIYKDKEKCMADFLQSNESVREVLYHEGVGILFTSAMVDENSQIFSKNVTASDLEAVQCQSQSTEGK